MSTEKTTTISDAVRNLIVCDTQFGWTGTTTLKLQELLDLQARGWLAEGDDNNEFELTLEGSAVVARALQHAKGAATDKQNLQVGEAQADAQAQLIEEAIGYLDLIAVQPPLVDQARRALARALHSRRPVEQEPIGRLVYSWNVHGHSEWDFIPADPAYAVLKRTPKLGGQFADQRFDVYAAPPAQGIDLGGLRKVMQDAISRFEVLDRHNRLKSLDASAMQALRAAVALIDGRDARTGVRKVIQPNEPGRTLYVDLDGVMADFDGSFPQVFGLDHRSMADDEMWGHINGHPSFFRDLPPMAGALEFFRSVEHLNPVILTACPKSNYAHVAAQKRAWVRAHLSQTCLVLPVLGGRHKPLFMHQPGDVLIDDWGKNCVAWTEAGGVAIKHEGDWAETLEALASTGVSP